ncbi:MAG: ATP-binding protein, partial [Gammaproteobacteria bacterium]|nr:ATP-binding protein [Gammaproteobacteria bacterium]
TVPLLLMLLDAFYAGEERSITIEEPEAHLFPYSQYRLIEFISRCYNGGHGGGKFVITTHSPYILTSFNNLLFAHQIAGLSEDAASRANAIVSEPARINPENFSAYYIEDGILRSILDKGLIADNEIDDTSEDIAEVFDHLLAIYRRYNKVT